jgi:hypothetical protein
MNDAAAKAVQAELDAALKQAPADAGIAFGFDLFLAFTARGWLTMEDFGAAGASLYRGRLPAYQRTHFAFVSLDVPDEDYEIGT